MDTETTHQCPPEGSGTMPCCDRTPFEVPDSDRMTLEPELVTCTRKGCGRPLGTHEFGAFCP